jgi:hypothetical protein
MHTDTATDRLSAVAAAREVTAMAAVSQERLCFFTGTDFGPGFLPGPGKAGVLGVERLCRRTGTVLAMIDPPCPLTVHEHAFVSWHLRHADTRLALGRAPTGQGPGVHCDTARPLCASACVPHSITAMVGFGRVWPV